MSVSDFLGFAALMAVGCGILVGILNYFSDDAASYRKQAREEARARRSETGTSAPPTVWLGVCGGLADSWDVNRTAARWLYVLFTIQSYFIGGIIIYFLLKWKGPQPLDNLVESPDVVYKGVCANIADRYKWNRRTTRTICAAVTVCTCYLPGFVLYHAARLFRNIIAPSEV